jgi:hypothetical protein
MVSRKIRNEIVLVPIKQNVGDLQNIYTMNEVGVRIWEIIKEKHTLPDIISIINDEFEVEKNQLTNDIIKFLNELDSAGAVDIE